MFTPLQYILHDASTLTKTATCSITEAASTTELHAIVTILKSMNSPGLNPNQFNT
jgi:hypothetical protein